MKFIELLNYLDEQFPKSLALSGDNDGVDVCVDYDLEIGRVLVVLDVTFEAINYAITNGYNCIISHHTMIYQPLKKLDLSSTTIKKAVTLVRNNICSAAFHTRLDSVRGGVNDSLVSAMGIGRNDENTELLYAAQDPEIAIGRVVTLDEEIDLRDFVSNIKKSMIGFYKKELSCDIDFNVNYKRGSGKVKKIGIVSGGGMSFTEAAVKMGADTVMSGEGNYGNILDLYETYHLNAITAGHFETEAVVLPFLRKTILEKFPDAKVDCFVGENIGL